MEKRKEKRKDALHKFSSLQRRQMIVIRDINYTRTTEEGSGSVCGSRQKVFFKVN